MNDSDSGSGPDLLDQLAFEFAERYRRGEYPSLSEYTQKYPQLAEQIRELFPALAVMEEFGSDAGKVSGPRRIVPKDDAAPEQLGEYRILREIARGGMGVVYEAVQETLGRHVALKILPSHCASQPNLLERFRREARAAARLHHTNIVPVFGVGEDNGVYYYAMQFIQGQSLANVLQEIKRCRYLEAHPGSTLALSRQGELPRIAHTLVTGQINVPGTAPAATVAFSADELQAPHAADSNNGVSPITDSYSDWNSQPAQKYFRSVARVGVQLAEALAYAHQHGILHRDIKPSNLLLDLQGIVWITDFGLAKAEDDALLTKAGDIVGTVAYMPPERFRGVSEARGDVYSLGLTLYEMFTLQPAFAGKDKAQLIQAIMGESPPRPRQLAQHLPRDMETIVLKATARTPEQRYRSAAALAEDLQRFLDGRPIKARRVTAAERAWRWCRRNPVVAGLSAAVFVLLTVAGAAGWVASLLRTERDYAIASRQRAETAEQRATQAEREIKIRAHLARATAYRRSGQAGQRFLTLAEVREALKLNPDARLRHELRNEAASALLLPDMQFQPLYQMPADLYCLDFDEKHSRYAVADRRGACRVCRFADNFELHRLPAMGKPALCYLHSNGKFLAVLTDEQPVKRSLRVWDLQPKKAKLLFSLTGMHELSFHTRNAQIAVTRADGAIDIYDLKSVKRISRLPRATLWREVQVALHPTEPLIAVGSYFSRIVQIRDVRTGHVEVALPLKQGATALAWSPNGKSLAVGLGNSTQVRFYDCVSWRPGCALTTAQIVTNMRFSPDGNLLTTSGWAGIVELFDIDTGKKLVSTISALSSVRFNRGKKHHGCGLYQGKLGVCQVDTGREMLHLQRTDMPDHAVHRGYTAISPDGRLLAAAMSDGFGIWDLVTGRELSYFAMGKHANVSQIQFVFIEKKQSSKPATGKAKQTPSFALLVPTSTGVHQLPVTYDALDRNSMRIGPAVKLPIPKAIGLGQSRYGNVLVASNRAVGAMQDAAGGWIWHRRQSDHPIRIATQNDDLLNIAVSPDGRWVVTVHHAPHSAAEVWKSADGSFVKTLTTHGARFPHFSPDGRWLATGADNGRLFETATWKPGPRTGGVGVFGPAASKLFASVVDDGAVSLVNPETGREYVRLHLTSKHPDIIPTISPDGANLVLPARQTDKVLRVIDLRMIRAELKKMNLDWDAPAYPPQISNAESVSNVVVDWDINPNVGRSPQERSRAAIERFRKRLASNPKSATACNGLAWHLLIAPEPLRDAKAALPFAETAVAKKPGDPNHINTLGVAYYRNERYRDAIKTMTPNTRNASNLFIAWDLYFLAMAHHKLGETTQGRIYFDWAGRQAAQLKHTTPQTEYELSMFRAEAEAVFFPRK